MFVLGFAVAFAGIGGPRLVGLATGTQLLYILPCFPPFDPGSLGHVLARVPRHADQPYRTRSCCIAQRAAAARVDTSIFV